MYDICILHTREDRKYARLLGEALKSRGYKIWWDIQSIPDNRLGEEIEGIINVSSAALVLWSERSVKSDIVRSMASHALKQNHLVPLRIDNTWLPLEFKEFNTLDISHWSGDPNDKFLAELLKSAEKSTGISSYRMEGSRKVKKALDWFKEDEEFGVRNMGGDKDAAPTESIGFRVDGEDQSGEWDREGDSDAAPEENLRFSVDRDEKSVVSNRGVDSDSAPEESVKFSVDREEESTVWNRGEELDSALEESLDFSVEGDEESGIWNVEGETDAAPEERMGFSSDGDEESGVWDMEDELDTPAEETETSPPDLSQKDPPRSAYALLDCPDSVQAMKEFAVTIGLSGEKMPKVIGGRLWRPDSSLGPFTLKVRLICDGFRLRAGEASEMALRVTAKDPYPTVERHLTALMDASLSDNRVLMAQFSVDGQMIGAAARSIEVGEDVTEAPGADAKLKASGVDMVVPPLENAPDMTITITPGNTASGDRLIWSMDTIHPKVGKRIPEDEDLTTDLGDSPAAWAKTLMNKVNSKEGAIDLQPFLVGTGRTIAGKIPYAIRKKLLELSNHIRDREPTLLIISGEPHVPWELAYTSLGERGRNFLAMEFVVGRWVLGSRDVETGKQKPPLPPPESLTVNDMFVISGNYSETKGWDRLEEAEKESADLQERYNATPIDANLEKIVTWLSGGVDAELIHFSVHGKYDPSGIRDGLAMVDGKMLEPTVIRAYTLEHQPFVFLNACQVGQGNTILGDYGGMAEAFLYAGASGVIAPLWSVDDESAKKIAKRFYTGLEAGEDPAEMVRRERQSFKNNSQSGTFLAYQFFGHPKMQIGMKLKEGGHNHD